jgi:transposase-like protein
MSKRTRRRHSPEQKAALVRQHVVDKKPVSEICSVAQIQPSVFYKWERDLLEAAPALFAGRRAPSREQELEAKIAALEAKLVRKDAIIAEVSEEYVKLKKLLGSPDGRLGAPRHARSSGRFRAGLQRPDGAGGDAGGRLDRDRPREVLRLAAALRPGQ